MNLSEFIPTMNVAGILAFLAPFASAALNRLTYSPQVKQIIAVVVSIVLAVFALFATDGINQIPGTANPVVWIATLILIVVAISQLSYQLIWKPTGLIDKVAVATATKKELATIDARDSDGVPNITDVPQHRAE
jgi:hypothetical protein